MNSESPLRRGADPVPGREIGTVPAAGHDEVASACALAAVGRDLIGEGRPDEAFGALGCAVRSAPPAPYWPAELRSALWELVCLLLDGSVSESVRTNGCEELSASLAALLERFALAGDRVLCLIGLAVNISSGGEVHGLARAADLRALARRRARSGAIAERGLTAAAFLGSAAIRQALGLASPEAHEATRLLVYGSMAEGSWCRRLLTRSLIMETVDARRAGRPRALSAASEAVGHANQLHAGFRSALLAQALTSLSSVLGDLGRHPEAMRAAVDAIGVTALGRVSSLVE